MSLITENTGDGVKQIEIISQKMRQGCAGIVNQNSISSRLEKSRIHSENSEKLKTNSTEASSTELPTSIHTQAW